MVVIAELGDIIKKQTGELQFRIWGDYWFKSFKGFFKGLLKKLYCLRSLGQVWVCEFVCVCYTRGEISGWEGCAYMRYKVMGCMHRLWLSLELVCVNTGNHITGFLDSDLYFWFPEHSASVAITKALNRLAFILLLHHVLQLLRVLELSIIWSHGLGTNTCWLTGIVMLGTLVTLAKPQFLHR